MIYNLLKSKGFDKELTIDNIITWLATKNIYLDLQHLWEDNEDKVVGYTATIYIPPYKNYIREQSKLSFLDAIITVLYRIYPSIPKIKKDLSC